MTLLLDYYWGGRSIVQDVFIETGTGQGETLAHAVKAGFKKCYSIECLEQYATLARHTLGDQATIITGSSPTVLSEIIDPSLSTTFWLDAHDNGLSKSEFDPKEGLCPLARELEVIFSFKWTRPPIVLIDDVSHTLEEDGFGYPTLEEIALKFPREYIMSLTADVLACLPFWFFAKVKTSWSCHHCHKALVRAEWLVEGGLCRRCGVLCPQCALRSKQLGGCEPFLKQDFLYLGEKHGNS